MTYTVLVPVSFLLIVITNKNINNHNNIVCNLVYNVTDRSSGTLTVYVSIAIIMFPQLYSQQSLCDLRRSPSHPHPHHTTPSTVSTAFCSLGPMFHYEYKDLFAQYPKLLLHDHNVIRMVTRGDRKINELSVRVSSPIPSV